MNRKETKWMTESKPDLKTESENVSKTESIQYETQSEWIRNTMRFSNSNRRCLR